MFNKQISHVNRVTIAKGLAEEFGIRAQVPNGFDGIPLLNNLNATFYAFADSRKEGDIDHLWDLFDASLALSSDEADFNRTQFCKYFDRVHDQVSVRWKITMGLFWVRPYTFINLDSRNRWFISDATNMPAEFVVYVKDKIKNTPPYATEYLAIRDMCLKALATGNYEYTTFPELSRHAWLVSERVNEEIKAEKNEKTSQTLKSSYLRWFNPLIEALRDLGGSATPADVRERIAQSEHLSDDELNAKRGKSNVNRFSNELAFARNDLVSAGYIDNRVRGIWTLTELGKSVEMTQELIADICKSSRKKAQNKRKAAGKALADDDVESIHYWLYSPGVKASKWQECLSEGVMLLGWGEIGDFQAFDSKDEIREEMKNEYGKNSSYLNSAHAAWQFVQEMKIGDVVFAKSGTDKILGKGIVESDYEYNLDGEDEYNNMRRVKWVSSDECTLLSNRQLPQKTLTDITQYLDTVQELKALFADEDLDDEDEQKIDYSLYTLDDFLDEVFMTEDEYRQLVNVLRNKKNIILQGAPGVGKTYVAKRLAYSMMGVKDIERVMLVQFHQSYSYEDFIMGFRPTNSGFELKKGAFYNFCKKAEIDSDKEYFFIIDEINRGNLSKIFGELFMLIENDKRGNAIQLLYSDEKFAIPENVYIIGMMNTADRSLAMLDYALRRRFAFFNLEPKFTSQAFKEYEMLIDNKKFHNLISCIENLNVEIAQDESLGEGFCIGHSYFCNMESSDVNDEWLNSIVEYELIPLLKEYWFDEPTKVKDWSANLRSALK